MGRMVGGGQMVRTGRAKGRPGSLARGRRAQHDNAMISRTEDDRGITAECRPDGGFRQTVEARGNRNRPAHPASRGSIRRAGDSAQ